MDRDDRHDDPQRRLPLGEAEGTHAERKNRLGLALQQLACDGSSVDLALCQFCLWVFNATGGGVQGELLKSYEQLAARPWGLCCSKGKARSTAIKARRLGLVAVEENRYFLGGQRPNSYRIDWRGVGRIIDGQPPRPGSIGLPKPRLECLPPKGPPGITTAHPGSTTAHPGITACAPIKEITPSCTFLQETTVPDRKPQTGPEEKADDGGRERQGPWAGSRGDPAAAYFGDLDEFAEALCRQLSPADARPLRGTAFAVLPGFLLGENPKGRLLDLPRWIVWHRRQLSLRDPVMGPTEAHLLLTLGTALYAANMRQADVRKNRAAVFASTIARADFRRALPFVAEARRQLDQWLVRRPLSLTEELSTNHHPLTTEQPGP